MWIVHALAQFHCTIDRNIEFNNNLQPPVFCIDRIAEILQIHVNWKNRIECNFSVVFSFNHHLAMHVHWEPMLKDTTDDKIAVGWFVFLTVMKATIPWIQQRKKGKKRRVRKVAVSDVRLLLHFGQPHLFTVWFNPRQFNEW